MAFAPNSFESKGYAFPMDSASEPVVIPIDESKLTKIKIGKPKAVSTNTNIHPAGIPKIVVAGIPKVCIPGQDSFSLPLTVSAVDRPLVAGIPEVVIAKDPAVKDQNPGNFSSFGKLQGLNNAYIFCMLEDKSGNLWFGTDGGGVARYDGRSFTHYTEKEGLSTNSVVSLGEDKGGNIWIGSFGSGVTRFDGKAFTHFTVKEGLSSNNVFSIVKDKKGNLWFGTYGGGATKYDGEIFTHFTQKEGLSGNIVYSILEDKDGNIWFGTYGGGASKYDGQSFKHYTTSQGLSSNNLWIITQDNSGNLWFGTDGGGASRYDGKFFTHFTEKEGLANNNVFNITEDKSGNLWFSTYGEGISMYDGNAITKKNRDLSKRDSGMINSRGDFSNFTIKEGLANNIVYSILKDKTENLWFATFGSGVSKYDGKLFTHITENEGLSNSIVYSILEDSKGNMWFGTGGGGISVYKDQSIFQHFTAKEGLPIENINSIIEDKLGNIWFGTDGKGVMKYDPQAEADGINAWTQFIDKDGLSNNIVRSILEDSKGNIWMGTFGGGVTKYNASGNTGKYFTHFTINQGLSNNYVWSICEDRAGNIWFGTFGGGVSKFDGESFTHFTVKEGLLDNMVRSILEDKKGNIWFATGGGVSRYDGNKFIHFTEKQGLADLVVYSILEDKKGNLWFGTRMGLSKLTPDKLASYLGLVDVTTDKALMNEFDPSGLVPAHNRLFKNYSYEDGFLGIGCFANSICEDKNGTIWIGANDRLTAYHPEGDGTDTIAPNIQLTGLALFNENLNWLDLKKNTDTGFVLGNGVRVNDFKFDGVSSWYALPEHLSLAYNTNFLTFNFIGITQKSPKKVKYRYKLEGMDDHWSAITSRTEAPYGNLPPGPYTFKVKAMNGEGYWSNEYNYAFDIRSPWWYTWWAYSIYLLLMTGGIFGFIYFRSAALRRENKILEEKVELRTSQLQTSIENLKATQNKLIQSEKMASLGELTAGIAHEIQNPLNFVNNFSDVNTELIQELLIDNNSILSPHPSILASLNDISQNLQKINHHGKRADAIVKGMMQHSLAGTGKRGYTDLNTLSDEYLRLAYHAFQAGLPAKDKVFNATLKTDFDESIGLIEVVAQDIARALINLVTNAFYAVHEEDKRKKLAGDPYSPMVSVTTKRSGNTVEIRVEDNGPGIPQQLLDKIFQPFFTTKPTGQGTGLGLSLAYDLITKGHGGELKVETKEGEGSEFIIVLPLV